MVRFVFCLLLAGSLAAQPARHPGPQPDGSILLHNQWSLRPAGRQVLLGGFSVNLAVHPSGRYAAALDAGYGAQEVDVIDLRSGEVVTRRTLPLCFYGLAFSADGRELLCSGGGDEDVHCLPFADGKLGADRPIQVHKKSLRAVPCGIALDRAKRRLFVANVWGDCVSQVTLGRETSTTDFKMSGQAAELEPAPVTPSDDLDTLAAEKRAEAGLYKNDQDMAFPYACCLDEKHDRLYVSLWARASVAVIDLTSGRVAAVWPVDEHPCEMALTRSGNILYVANANRNTVSVLDTATGRTRETIWAAFYPDSPPGSTPNSLALSPDEKTLYVAVANVNAVAVFDVSQPTKSRSLGFIPVGWYPTSVRVTPDGKRLLVANGKGIHPKANPAGPQPGHKTAEYIAYLYPGTLDMIDLPRGPEREAQMAAWTADVYRSSPLRTNAAPVAVAPPGGPIPGRVGDLSPIRYCIYIIKENRTYDQVLGDLPQGNGDPKLCLFPERVTPNEHKIAREFVLLDNIYCDAEVSASGHEWSMSAYCSDFVEKTWPIEYGHDHDGKFPYPAEGCFPIATPASGYIWDRAREAGVSYRSYGEFCANRGKNHSVARVKTLEGHIDPEYRGFDLGYSDLKRADRFIAEFKRLEAEGDMPRLQIVRMPNDHTHGVTPGFPTPLAYAAENDLAVGRVVETVTHSKLWPQTALFIIEDDAQNGPDHVDAHRTTAYLVSPYTVRGVTDSTMYSTCSLLRTMELILGLKPMSQFDAAAMPMYRSFQSAPDLRPFDAVPANIDLSARTQRTAWGANIKMKFAKEDQADDFLLNEVIWKSVRGADSPLPAPVHAGFILGRAGDDDDD